MSQANQISNSQTMQDFTWPEQTKEAGRKAYEFLKKGSKPGVPKNRANKYTNIVALFGAFQNGPVSAKQIADRTGIYYDTVTVLLKHLHAGKVIHIDSWTVDTVGRYVIARYVFGKGVDALRPKAQTGSSRTRKYNIKKQKSQDKPLETMTATKVPNKALESAMQFWKMAA